MIILAWESDPMAREQAACNRAIRKAWQRERELVLAGKGTRNWTPEQRDQIITKGKVYDDDGKAFIGQHMKSVSGYPDNQGDAGNIQLLSQEEHLEAHKGDWHNITNWYYDPDTKTFYNFDVYDYSKFPPDDYCNFHPDECRISLESFSEEPLKEKSIESTASKKKGKESPKPSKPSSEKTEHSKPKIDSPKESGLFSKILGGAKKTAKKHLTQIKEHPLECVIVGFNLIKTVFDIIDVFSDGHSSDSGKGVDTSDEYPSSADRNTDFNGSVPEAPINDVLTVDEEDNDSSSGTPKSPHSRRGYSGHRWKKNKNGDLELTESWISPAIIHADQMDDEESEDE